MSEQAFAPDFLFSRIKNVNFGSEWFGVGIDLSVAGRNPVDQITVNFPDFAGGTPGVQIYPAAFSSYPHAVTNADLRAKLRTGGGASLNLFGLQAIKQSVVTLNLQNVSTTGYSNGVEAYFQMLRSAPFRVTVDVKGHPIPSAFNPLGVWGIIINGFVVPKGQMKAGLSLPPPPLTRTVGLLTAPVTSEVSHTFLVTPSKMTIQDA